MNKIKCKDFFIIKVLNYADKKILTKWHIEGGPMPTQHRERAEMDYHLYSEFVKYVTGRSLDEWRPTYHYDTMNCVSEEIYEHYGIIIQDNEGYRTFLIPIGNTKCINWITKHIKAPYRIVQKIVLGSSRFDGLIRYGCRERCIEFQKQNADFLKQIYPEQKNPL